MHIKYDTKLKEFQFDKSLPNNYTNLSAEDKSNSVITQSFTSILTLAENDVNVTEADVNELPQSKIFTENLIGNKSAKSCQTRSHESPKCLYTSTQKEFFDNQNIVEENFMQQEGDKCDWFKGFDSNELKYVTQRSDEWLSKIRNLNDNLLTSHVLDSDMKFIKNLLEEMTYTPLLLSPISSFSGMMQELHFI